MTTDTIWLTPVDIDHIEAELARPAQVIPELAEMIRKVRND